MSFFPKNDEYLKFMSFILRLRLLVHASLIFCCSIPNSLLAHNYHEHLQYLYLPENVADLGESLLNAQLRSKKFIEFFFPRQIARSVAKEILHVSLEQAEDLTFEQAVLLAGEGNFRAGILKLLQLPSEKKLSTQQARELYLSMGSLRYGLLSFLSTEAALQIFQNYFESEPQYRRKVIEATVFVLDFLNPTQAQFLTNLQQLAAKFGTNLSYFGGWSHFSAIDGIPNLLEDSQVIQLTTDKKIRGFDLVGSIFEGDDANPPNSKLPLRKTIELFAATGWHLNPKGNVAKALASQPNRPLNSILIEQQLRAFFDFHSTHNLELRLHAFETSRTGPFYKALEHLLSTYNKPLQLRLGHAMYLTPKWISLFKSNSQISLTVDVNRASNLALSENASDQRLNRVERLLIDAKIPVRYGFDGRGLLPQFLLNPILEKMDCAARLQ